MRQVIQFLSGEVPGGIILFIVILLIINLTIYFFKSSQLISAAKSKRLQLVLSGIVLFIYVSLWLVMRPPKPQERIIILPVQTGEESFALTGAALRLAEMMQQLSVHNTRPKYLLHRWEWLLETIGPDSADYYAAWRSIAKRLDPGIVIESRKDKQKLICSVHSADETRVYEISQSGQWETLIRDIDSDFKIYKKTASIKYDLSENYLNAKIAYINKDYEKAEKILKDQNDNESQVLLAAVYMQRGLAIKIDRERAKYTQVVNPQFEKAKRIAARLLREKRDTPFLSYVLGRIAIREQEFAKADLYLKNAYVRDPYNCRIHFALSYLLSERLDELGYYSKTEILERAIEIDPGYTEAVYRLADEYYTSGTGARSALGTTRAMETIEAYLKIKSEDPEILSLLAVTYLKTQRFDEALKIFKELNKRFPENSDTYYNVGLTLFHKKEYDKAMDYFRQAIEMDNHLDSYLYVGAIHRVRGVRDSALYYYRERVVRKTGDDDQYADEAMEGIRKILFEIEKEKQDEK